MDRVLDVRRHLQPDAFSAQMLGWAGFDWVCVDLQHGMVGPDALRRYPAGGLDVTGTPVFVRVPWNHPAAIMRALDTGAAGVIVPMVNSAAEAALGAVAAMPLPTGRGPEPGSDPSGPRTGRVRHRVGQRRVICAVMIETREAMDALDYFAVPGVDAAFVGPSDLAVAHGFPPSLRADDPAVGALIATIVARCQAHGVVPAIFTSGVESALRWHDAGFRLLTVGSDRLLMTEAAKGLMSGPGPALVTRPRVSRRGSDLS